jgi:hypothetical protein
MSKALAKALYKAAALTFEDLGFMLPSSELDDSQKKALPLIAVAVRFHGPVNGKVVVTICGPLLPTLAANMLGESDHPSEAQQHDALREISNVICGNMLPLIAGTQPVFNVELPEIVEPSKAIAPEEPVASTQIGIEEGRAELRLYVDNLKALEELRS